jgi:AraC-like DNA-binding protein
VGVEVMSQQALRARAGAALVVPERVDFYLLLFVHAGRGRHMVDFVEYPLGPGHVVFVRPGQVQQWLMRGSQDGDLVLISPEALAPSIARAGVDMKLLSLDAWPVSMVPSKQLFKDAMADVARLRRDIERFEGGAIDAALIWHELLALFLRLARERSAQRGGDVPRETEIYRMFMRELERQFDQRRSVRELAQRIGYSESTLSRACVAAAGHTAKQVVDLRIALEAKRLLVHSGATAAQIGHQLGFTEPTNFVKFFRRMAGVTPLEFRAAQAPRAAAVA